MKSLPAQQLAPLAAVDLMVVRAWLHGRARNTALAYEADARKLLAFAAKPIAELQLADLQAWDASMAEAAPASRARRMKAAKSLLSFAAGEGMVQVNAGAGLRVRKTASSMQERILSQAEVARLITAETDPRRHALLRLLYVCGLRASEAAGLRWRHLTGSPKKGYALEVVGKGDKLRRVAMPADLRSELAALTPSALPDSPLVPAHDGGPLDRSAVWRVFKRAAKRAGLDEAISPHWARHSHGTHAIENGCDLHVLQKTMGHASIATTGVYLHVKAGDSSSSFIKG